MNRTIISLAAMLVLVVAPSAFAQFTSSPLEPGFYEYSRSHGAGTTLVDQNNIRTDAVRVEWVSPEQVTLTATIAQVEDRSEATRAVDRYNDCSSVGTMRIESTTILLVHHVNPKQVQQSVILQLLEKFSTEVDRQKIAFRNSLAAK